MKPDCQFKIFQKDLPLVITLPGVYKIEEDLSYTNVFAPAITINSNSVTIDGGDHIIDLGGLGIQAIKINAVRQIEIKDLNIINGSFTPLLPVIIPPFNPIPVFPTVTNAVIGLNGSANVVIRKVDIDNVLYGIVGIVDKDIVIEDCQIFEFGKAATISGLTQPVGAGIIISGVSPNTNAKDITIKRCQIQSELGFYGILLNFVTGFSIKDNEITAGRVSVVGQNLGCITFTDTSSGTVKNCVLRFSTQPIFALRSNGIDIVDSEIKDSNQDGAEFVFCNHCSLVNNIIKRILDVASTATPGSGIKVSGSTFFTVKNNIVTDFAFGGSLTDNNGAGISINASKNSVIQDNTVQGNNFGIKEILVINIGPPPPRVGQPSTYLRNIAVGNLIQNYLGIPNVNPPVTAGPWDNISVAYLP